MVVFNQLAGRYAVLGAVVGVPLALTVRSNTGTIAICTAATVVLGLDLWYRFTHTPELGSKRVFSADTGGVFYHVIPAWVIAVLFFALGVSWK